MAPSRRSSPPNPAAADANNASQPSIVLIDEGHGWPDDLVNQLREDGYAVARLFSFALVPVLVRTHGIQAVLVDLHRLRVSDLTALRQCRQDSPDTAVVLVSSTTSPQIRAQALDWGATVLLIWPAARAVLRAALLSAQAPSGPAEK